MQHNAPSFLLQVYEIHAIALKIHEMFILYVGFDTTATTLTYCLYELSQNVELQEKARQSVTEALKKHKNALTYDLVSEMKYLEQCVKGECLID